MKRKNKLQKGLKQIELLIRRIFLLYLQLRRKLFHKKRDVTSLLQHLGESPSILLLRQDRLGDAIITTPLLVAIRKKFPKAKITMLLGGNNRAIAPLLPADCETVVYTKNPKADRALMRSLRERSFDVMIDLTDNASVTSSMLVTSIQPKVAIGVEKENAVVYDVVVPRIDREKYHITQRIVELLRPLGIDPIDVDLRPQLQLQRAEKVRGRVGINISAGSESRYAPEQVYAQIALAVIQNDDVDEVSLLCEPGDKIIAERIALLTLGEVTSGKIAVLGPTPSYADFATLLSTCEVLITPDTSIVHLGAALELPMVVIYAPIPTGLHYWTPLGVPYEMCIQRPSLASLEPGTVIALFNTLWKRLHHAKANSVTTAQ